jgi:predicted GH43/DUF377 family glycosyl hydrolase
MTPSGTTALVSRTPGIIRPDRRRVVARLFVPGQETFIHGRSRVDPVIKRILALDEETVAATLADLLDRFNDRHSDLTATFAEHFEMVAHRLDGAQDLPASTKLLVGAHFTDEYSIESAAVFNPSIVEHPDQNGVAAGELRVILSLRAVGEGHLSAIEFRTGTVAADGSIRIDDAGRLVTAGRRQFGVYHRSLFLRMLRDLDDWGEDGTFVLESLPDPFSHDELEYALAVLHDQQITRNTAERTISNLRWIASCSYVVTFPAESSLSERALLPHAPIESHGMEDARFLRFTDDNRIRYFASYTAYHGAGVRSQLIETSDFQTFRMSPVTGPAADNKGMALFPRRIGGRFFALSRWDRENTSVATSNDGRNWEEPVTVATPTEPWELIQIGNCGPPIETAFGWLVLTHGVGPMRTYGIGAMLLDLDDPTKVLGQLRAPLFMAQEDERDGYVPNVVYSCGAIVHNDLLVVPYGSADNSVGVATFELPRLLELLNGHTGSLISAD